MDSVSQTPEQWLELVRTSGRAYFRRAAVIAAIAGTCLSVILGECRNIQQPLPLVLVWCICIAVHCCIGMIAGAIGAGSAVNTLSTLHKSWARALLFFALWTLLLLFAYRTAFVQGPRGAFISGVVSLGTTIATFFTALYHYEEPVDDLLLREGECLEELLQYRFRSVFKVGFTLGAGGYFAALLFR